MHVIFHYKGKLLENDSADTKQERQVILASGPLAYTECKLLGIPVVDDGTGKSQAKGCIESSVRLGCYKRHPRHGF